MSGTPGSIVGRRINAVVLKAARNRRSPPATQLFLVFDDGTYYEFYTGAEAISCAGGFDQGGLPGVLGYMPDHMQVIYCAAENPDTGEVSEMRYGHPADGPSHE
jgi:hypothetical protein